MDGLRGPGWTSSFTAWYARNPGIPFLQAAWNVVYMEATQHLLTQGGAAIVRHPYGKIAQLLQVCEEFGAASRTGVPDNKG